MWVSHVTRRNIVLMLQLLCILPEHMILIRAHYICEVGQEKDKDNIRRWVLPYKDPCKCTSIRFGGLNMETPKRPFDPVYVEEPLIGDNVTEIIEHYHLDCIAPSFETCPADFEIQTETGKATAMVVYQTPNATDNSGQVSVQCNPPSTSELNMRQARITCEALDGSGNSAICEFLVDVKELAMGQTNATCVAQDSSGNIATCEFRVNVEDIEAPVITGCPAEIETQTDPRNATALVVYQTPNAIDNSGVMTLTCDALSESEFNIGQTIVTCVAYDSSGNNATCKFQVEVKDIEDPLISACTDHEKKTDPGTATAIYQSPTASDNSGEVTLVCAPLPESKLNMGQTMVTCVAHDSSGNDAICTFQVEVKDEEAPVIAECYDQEQETDPGTATALYQVPTASDNSVEVILVCDPLPESRVNMGQTDVTCVAHDSSGNMATCIFLVEVIDAEAPIITCPANQEKETNPGNVKEIMVYPTPDANDNSGVVTLTCAPPSESEFNITQTDVTCMAVDSSGNTATCEVRVDVKETYCSTGWEVKEYDTVDPGDDYYAFVAPNKYISCNGVITEWRFFPKRAHELKAVIWRHDVDNQFTVIGINTINVTAEQVDKPLVYIVPENEQIEVQAGDMIGGRTQEGGLTFTYASGDENLVPWKYDAPLSQDINVIFDEYDFYEVAMHATVKPFEATWLENGWILFGYHCYLVSNTKEVFHAAEDRCQVLGGHLASIHSLEEQKFVKDNLQPSSDYWIGFTDQLVDGTFEWIDDTTVTYTNWDEGHVHVNEDCGAIHHSGSWRDRICSNSHYYICKKAATRI